ncbi:MAG: phosphoribosylamine--glycine ligase [Candidatus Aenigmatarchaeota archaeon]|nr:MAG: phosphoribosylamine--glycine ligase [Candidatus Aenigmarchaeota archaeon]
MKRILLVGNGAREHAIADALARSPQKPELYCFMKAKNPGMAKMSAKFKLAKLDDFDALGEFVKEVRPDFAIIGPEDPLNAGVVDFLQTLGVRSVGPVKDLARLETSKTFTRELLEKYRIPANIKFRKFISTEGIKDFIEAELGDGFVVKPDGLTGGKGVMVSGEHLKDSDEAVEYCRKVLETHPSVIVEEKIEGEEFSLQCISDGRTIKATPPVQDHKRLLPGDQGPNTGGMGSYSYTNHLLQFLTKEDVLEAEKIVQMTCDAIRKETGKEYKGIMYGGFMLTKDGPKLLEYNARFGDPEVMNVLPILKTDFVSVCEAVINGTLSEIELHFENKATVCKYVVPEGYPSNPVAGQKIELDEANRRALIFHASIDQKDDGLYMTTSRAIGFVGVADDIAEAEKIAESAIKAVKGPVFHREDIGTPELLDRRVKHMEAVRGES